MSNLPPIFILNGIENENNQQYNKKERFNMPDYCQEHAAHVTQINNNAEKITKNSEDIKGMSQRISDRVKSKVFWALVLIFCGAMGTMFNKQEKVLNEMRDISTTFSLMQRDIQDMQEDIAELTK